MNYKNSFFHIPNRLDPTAHRAEGSANEGFYTILMAAVLGLMSSTGVYFLNEKVIKGKAQMSAEETASEARTNNETVKNLISALVTYKNPRSTIYDDPSAFPAGYFSNYFASEASAATAGYAIGRPIPRRTCIGSVHAYLLQCQKVLHFENNYPPVWHRSIWRMHKGW